MRGLTGWLALAAVLASALALGANRPISWLALAVAAFALLALYCARELISPSHGRRLGRLWLPALLMLGALSWGALQTFAAPADALSGLFSAHLAADLAHPAWQAVGASGTISADPLEGRHVALKLCAYVAFFMLAVDAGMDDARASAMVRVAGVFIAALCAFGLFAVASGINPVLGEEAPEMVSATFINRNSFATFAAFGVMINLALLLEDQRVNIGQSRRRAVRDFLEGFLSTGWLFSLAFLVCAVALAASQSRGGALAAVTGAGMLLAMRRANGREGGGPILIVAALGALFVIAISATGVFNRLVAGAGEDLRFLIYGRVIDGIAERPWLGHGLGAFEDVFRALVPPDAAAAEWDKAHNSYLELAFELGLPAAAAVVLALALVSARIFAGAFTRQRNLAVPLAGAGCVTVAAVHSAFDFSLQIPAIGALFAMILGLSWAQGFRRNAR